MDILINLKKEINHKLKNFTIKKMAIEKNTNEITEVINASAKGADKYETKIKFVKGIMHEDYSISRLKHSPDNPGIEGLVYEILSWDKNMNVQSWQFVQIGLRQ